MKSEGKDNAFICPSLAIILRYNTITAIIAVIFGKLLFKINNGNYSDQEWF